MLQEVATLLQRAHSWLQAVVAVVQPAVCSHRETDSLLQLPEIDVQTVGEPVQRGSNDAQPLCCCCNVAVHFV